VQRFGINGLAKVLNDDTLDKSQLEVALTELLLVNAEAVPLRLDNNDLGGGSGREIRNNARLFTHSGIKGGQCLVSVAFELNLSIVLSNKVEDSVVFSVVGRA